MKRVIALPLALLLFAQIGCLRPFTSRLDRANEHLEQLRGQLEQGNAKVAESAERLRRMEQHLEEMNRRMQTMERFLKRFGGGADAEASSE